MLKKEVFPLDAEGVAKKRKGQDHARSTKILHHGTNNSHAQLRMGLARIKKRIKKDI